MVSRILPSYELYLAFLFAKDEKKGNVEAFAILFLFFSFFFLVTILILST